MSPAIQPARKAQIGSAKTSGAKRGKALASEANAARRGKQRQRIPGAKKIVNDQLPAFSRQLASMLSAGMPIVSCLETLEEQTDNPAFKPVIRQVAKNIENGSALSESLRMFPAVFDTLYCNMVKGGETGGQLAETISRLAGFLEASARLRRKVKSAMMYPTIVMCIALGIAAAMIVFIVPVFGEMFADFGAQLPGPTQFLLNVSGWSRKYGIFLVLGIVAFVILFKKWKATPSGAYAFDSALLKFPVFGELNQKVASARFARTFGQLIRSGVPILDALEIVSGATGNNVASRVIVSAREAVEKGEPLSSGLQAQTVFPIMLVRMMQAGEKTGKVDEMMDNIAEFYDDEVETMLAGLTSLLEPLLMIFLGVIIGGIVVCMFLPIFKMGEIVGG
jgi:type IV pilus assembly protein PilC